MECKHTAATCAATKSEEWRPWVHVSSRRTAVASLTELTEFPNVYRRNIAGPKNTERTRRSATSFSRCDDRLRPHRRLVEGLRRVRALDEVVVDRQQLPTEVDRDRRWRRRQVRRRKPAGVVLDRGEIATFRREGGRKAQAVPQQPVRRAFRVV